MITDELRKAAKCVFLAADEPVAADLSRIMTTAANQIDALLAECDDLKATISRYESEDYDRQQS